MGAVFLSIIHISLFVPACGVIFIEHQCEISDCSVTKLFSSKTFLASQFV
jgi:hypothetical protein